MASKVRDRIFTSEDFAQLGAILVFIVQAGASTVRQIKDTLKRLGAKVHWRTLENTLENLRGRGLLVKESRSNDEGHMEAHYRTSRVKYAKATIEVAHIKDLIPVILADPAGKEIMEELNAMEAGIDPDAADRPPKEETEETEEVKEAKGNGKGNGDARTQKGGGDKFRPDARTWYKDYWRFWIKWVLLEPIYGSQPFKKGANKLLVRTYLNSPYKNPDLPNTVKGLEGMDPEPLLFERDFAGGAIKIHRAAVRGWLRGVLRVNDLRESIAEVTSTRSIFICPSPEDMDTGVGKVEQVKDEESWCGYTTVIHPIQAGPNSREKGTGLGLALYECLLPGTEFQMVIDFPCPKGSITPEEFCEVIKDGGLYNPRNLSPARGTQTGAMQMLSCHARSKRVRGKEHIVTLYENGGEIRDLGQDEDPQ